SASETERNLRDAKHKQSDRARIRQAARQPKCGAGEVSAHRTACHSAYHAPRANVKQNAHILPEMHNSTAFVCLNGEFPARLGTRHPGKR
ncbi:MAG: hypothetical protein VB065_06465, partial [Eubacteriales bacterium]|nr:hypothetical protein [Eubacteriales bacterium]